jgi:hypothetical protein
VAGYSSTPLARKLGIRGGATLGLLAAPPDWEIPELPPEVRVVRRARGKLDVIVAFCRSRSELRRRLPVLARALAADGGLWIAWPRRAGGHQSDITEGWLRELILPTGLVDNKVAALNEDWSGLRFVWRRELRAEVAARAGEPAA